MRTFDDSKPLIFIHIPKTAGVSVRGVVASWFPGNVHYHYFNRAEMQLPKMVAPDVLNDAQNPPVIYGHFNKKRSFGIEDYYPEVNQFLTIMRDPVETIISNYFYVRKAGPTHFFYPATQVSLVEYVRSVEPYVLNHFPREMTMANFKDILEEYFIDVGITEMLSQSLANMAGKLGKPFDPETVKTLNQTERDQTITEECRAAYAERNPLESAIYSHVRERVIASGASSPRV